MDRQGALPAAQVRWGLCCLVVDAPIAFRSATHSYVTRLSERERLAYVDGVALHNARALAAVLTYCASLGIGAFRISSQLFPLATHPASGYRLDALPGVIELRRTLAEARHIAERAGIRLSFHPDQFVVINSVRPDVIENSLAELEWQGELADILGADVICIHGGSAAGGQEQPVERLIQSLARLSPRAFSRIALENDDRSFGASDLLPACLDTGVPFVLDAHHHRVLSRDLSIEDATDWAVASWGEREPHFHVSSPRAGWNTGDPRPHADFVNPADVPAYWFSLDIPLTVDVEAKAKERAVLALQEELGRSAFLTEPARVSSKRAAMLFPRGQELRTRQE